MTRKELRALANILTIERPHLFTSKIALVIFISSASGIKHARIIPRKRSFQALIQVKSMTRYVWKLVFVKYSNFMLSWSFVCQYFNVNLSKTVFSYHCPLFAICMSRRTHLKVRYDEAISDVVYLLVRDGQMYGVYNHHFEISSKLGRR